MLVPHYAAEAQDTVASGSMVSASSNSGSASMGVPINVPPGRNGIAPNVALLYNSGAGSGWAGVGWDVALGEVRRATKKGIDYGGNDFVFSGSDGSATELVTRGDWGTNYYGAKIEGLFSKYYYNSATGGWEVTTKDGVKYYYGSTTTSRQNNTFNLYSNNQVLSWRLDRVQDTNGNYMTVTYVKDNGIIYPDRIDYTGNAGTSPVLSPSNYVKFNRYLDIHDVPYGMLKSIETYAGGQLAGQAVLSYIMSGNTVQFLLNTVTFYGSDGSATMPPIALSYQNSPHAFGQSVTAPMGTQVVSGDFNGDGRADVAFVENGHIHVYLSTGSGFSDAGYWGSLSNANSIILAGDLNGDGKADIYELYSNTSGNPVATVRYSNGSTFTQPVSAPAPTLIGNYKPGDQVAIGDFNGDGKADIALLINSSIQVYLSTGNGFVAGFPPPVGFATPGAFSGPGVTSIFAGDFNGDGFSDLYMTQNTGGSVYPYVLFSTGSYFVFSSMTEVPMLSGPAITIADFNGDGKADIAINQVIYYSNGSYFFSDSSAAA